MNRENGPSSRVRVMSGNKITDNAVPKTMTWCVKRPPENFAIGGAGVLAVENDCLVDHVIAALALSVALALGVGRALFES